ncbi:DUF4270 family protein [Cesiribacter andamanensis]|uniref:DUF4270 domain-containing protein n=1 Tax=Cesiribacter andamanensis AMV16 TaxID=1279009 RepID=M7NZQ8_9BACT|nr:DUF4270 family protein [Cesiribacter andamanensis]EMR03834.1 hypothetical protein ADICEAN_00983 [Cesiribacter andamanensis AMV16]
MNLLVKKMGLALLPALFFACEEPTDLGANLNPNTGDLSTHYAEFSVSPTQVRSDSLYTSLRATSETAYFAPYIGRLQSPTFGTVQAELYANLSLPAVLPTLGTYVRLDSARLNLYWNNRDVYGASLTPVQNFSIHQLNAPIAPTRTAMHNDTIPVRYYNYYAGQTREVGAQIGQFSLDISEYVTSSTSLDTTAAIQQPAQRRISAPIDQALAEQLLLLLRSNQDQEREVQEAAFAEFFKGISIVPSAGNTFLTRYDITSLNAGLTLYYTQGTEQRTIRLPFIEPKPLVAEYYFTSHPAYFALTTDRTGTGLEGASAAGHMEEFSSQDGRVYFQALSGIYPRLDLSPFKEFVLGMEDEIFILNRAVVEVDSVVAGPGARQPLPQGLELYFVDENNRRFLATVGTQQSPFERAFTTVNRTYAVGETNVNYYQSDVAYNLEQFLRTGEDRYLQAVLYPQDAAFYSPAGFAVRSNQLKLKLWYTKMKGSN